MNSKAKNITLLSGAIIASLGALQAAEKEGKPNLILINIDDLGWSDLSYNGSTYYETPNIDRLHNMGVNFNMGYAAAANSAPSRASMLTGQYTPRHKVFTVSSHGKKGNLIAAKTNNSIPENITTLPAALREGGYTTCHVGKWHVGSDPTKQGIDLNIGGNHTGSPKGGHFKPENNPQLVKMYGAEKIAGKCLTTLLGDAAENYIKTVSTDKPFFLYYSPYTVHSPLQADPTIVAKYEAKTPTEAHKNPKFAAMIEVMDRTVGQILDAVEERGIAENTVIVFTSDNGGFYNTSRQWPLRAGKGSFYEGGIREPFIVYQKGKIEGVDGSMDYRDVSVSHIDLFPTFMEMANVSYTELLDGMSLVPVLTKGDTKALEDRCLYWHFPDYLTGGNSESTTMKYRSAPLSVVRQGEWKLIRNYDLALGIDEFELYNIATDVSEKTNVAKANPEIVDQLTAKLTAWIKATDAPIPQAK